MTSGSERYPSGPNGERSSYMYFYPPTNRDVGGGMPGEKPPLLVKSHGGPTSAASPGFNLVVQYFTSRGFAVADVNYGGSTGYGRGYRELLKDNWGVVDVEDCSAAATHLARGTCRPLAAGNRRWQRGRVHDSCVPGLHGRL